MTEQFRNILLIQLGDIGDVVLTTPTIRAVKETYPEARVSILVRKPFGSILLADTNLHEVVETTQAHCNWLGAIREHLHFALRLRWAQYDLVIDLRTGDRGAILCFLTGAPIRVGLREDSKPFWYKHLFTKLLRDPPYAELPVHPGAGQSLRIVRAMSIDTDNSTPKLYLSSKDKGRALELIAECGLLSSDRWITINPCSRWKYKEWEYAKWEELIDHLWRDHHLPTVLVGSPEEVAVTQKITMGRSNHVFNLAGKTTLGELSAVIAMSTLHLGVDSAAPHIATSVGTPTLTIFGPGNWKSWTIVDALHRVVTAAMQCVPCNQKGCNDSEKSQCLDDLGVDQVYAEVQSILAITKQNYRITSLTEKN